MTEKKELTYILGAGASYESIPVVKTFAERFDKFCSYLRLRSNPDYYLFENKELYGYYQVASNQVNFFKNELQAIYSFDTLFKKYFHLGKDDLIKLGKKVMHLYFLWEHLQTAMSKKPEQNGIKEIFWKQSIKDKRYDALILGLLQPIKNESKMFYKTNFITWNYDMNLLESIKNYFYPNEKFDSFLKKIITKNNPNVFNIKDEITIVNMNGYFYSQIFNHELQTADSVNNIHDYGENKILELLKNNFFNSEVYDTDSNKIQFAWELDDKNSNKAKEIISNSENIVIVGYTFPLYNRLVDLKYINKDSIDITKQKIYIQDPVAESLKDTFLNNFDFSTPTFKENVKVIKDCNSFFVPSNIHNPCAGNLPETNINFAEDFS